MENSVRTMRALVVGATLIIAGCGGGGGEGGGTSPPPPPVPTYTITGNVSGLTGTGLVLRNNGSDDKAVAASGAFTFGTSIASGGAYAVTVATQPSDQLCTVTNGSGTVSANVTNVTVVCTLQPHTIGGTVTGLTGTGLILQNNFGDDIVINGDGAFTFASSMTTGQAYQVTITLPPVNPVQVCTLSNATGSVNAANVTNISIACVTHHARFAFATNQTDGTISTFAIDDATGQWRPRTIVKTGSQPAGIIAEASRRFFYVLNRGSANISVYDIEANTAVLTEKATSPYPAGNNGVGTYPSVLGPFLYYPSTTSNNLFGYTMDATDGTLAQIPGSPYSVGPTSISQDATGKFLYLLLPTGQIVIESVNAITGALSEVSRVSVTGNASSLLLPRSGKYLYAVTANEGVKGFNVNSTTGLLTAFSTAPFTAVNQPLTGGIHPSGRFILLRDSVAGNISVVAINPTTGALTLAPGSPFITGQFGANYGYHPSGRYLYVATSANVSSYAIDVNTGAVTLIPGGTFALANGLLPYVEPTGKYAYVSTSGTSNRAYAFSINQTTGALSLLTNHPLQATGRGAIPLLLSAFTNGVSFRSDFAYVANAASNSVSAYTVDSTTGKLTSVGSAVAAGNLPNSVTMDLRARFLYATNITSNDISGYRIDATTGALTAMTGSPFTTGGSPKSMAIDPSGRFAYVTNSTPDEVRSYQIDQTTGALSAMGSPITRPVGSDPFMLTMHPNGLFVYLVSTQTHDVAPYLIDQTTGALTAIGPAISTGGAVTTSLAITSSGRFAYAANSGSNNVTAFSVDLTTGAVSVMGTPVAAGTNPRAIAIDPTNQFLYVANLGSNNISTYRINSSTGALTASGTATPTGNAPIDLKVDYSGKYLYVTNMNDAQTTSFAINPTTGALTAVANSAIATGVQPSGIAVSTRTF